MADLIDLLHVGRPRVIATYLLAGDEPALVDCGPSSCLGALEEALRGRGLEIEDLRHLVLTHIHLDHAGAAGTLVRRNPSLQVHVSSIGAPHLLDPSRLERSARRLYGEDFDRLWGELAPVPEASLRPVGARVLDLEAFPTAGHASHHVSFIAPDGTCFAGDAAGVRIEPSSFVLPASPPPDIDLEAWSASLDAIEQRRPTRLWLTHFGPVDDAKEHIALMREQLRTWAERVRDGATTEAFARAAEEDLQARADAETAEAYKQAAPFWQSHAGLERYWRKRREEEAA
jgi:glyoxylase-like metal-dependent hydrolase (beta-lactamase superfamily II)